MDDYDGQMIFGDLEGLKLPDVRLTGEEKPRENLTQETCPDRESNPGPLRSKRACYRLLHSGGLQLHGELLLLIIIITFFEYFLSLNLALGIKFLRPATASDAPSQKSMCRVEPLT